MVARMLANGKQRGFQFQKRREPVEGTRHQVANAARAIQYLCGSGVPNQMRSRRLFDAF
jgi:hypothetical protein